MKANARILMWGVITACLSFLGVAHAQTVTNWSENFDDGNGNNRWYADNGVWQIGTPTIGPGAAHSTNYCAGTGLTANYPVGANSRLIRFQSFVVPSANQFPRLRFWQWYIFSGSCNGSSPDYGVVEVKGTNGVWQSVSPGYTGNGGGWTYASVDLSAYAGQTVQVAFHIIFQNGCSSTSPGWYVDDIAFETGTPVFNNPEGFEGGIGDWYAESGSWQVGVPTSGPGAAHTGTNCAATILNGNYPVGANSRFVSPAFMVPATNQYPRLRFWHWYNFSGSCNGSSPDYGVVEVKGTNGVWQSVSPGYTGNGGGWTYASVDLSAYAGQTVQVAFHFVFQNGCSSTSPGWYVDDVSLVTGTPVFNNPEGFEGGIGDWYAESGSWQVGVPTSGPGAAHSGTNCAATVLNGNYPVGANSRFVSPAFVVPSASSSPYLRFWHWYNFSGSCNGSSPDLGVVEVRGTNGTWQTLSSQYTGNSSGWTEPALDLSAYAGQTVQVAFHFVFQNGCGSTSPGWYVDDVSIQSFGQPTILSPPASQTLSVGSSATLNVGASGDSPLSYQWRYNSNAIAGATNTTLPLTNVQLSQAGYYDVVVTNDAGSVTSTPPALLQVVISFGGVDIGDPGAPGNFTQSNGVYTVTGSGEQLSGTADAFYFIQQPLSGNCQIVARVTGLLGPAGAQAGIMIRETLDDGSKHASLLVDSSTNVVFRRRLTNDAYSVDTDYSRTNRAWLRLMRMGNDFVGLCSTNGTNWEYVWFTTISMSNQVQVGLAVTAHYNASYATATMDNVSIGSLSPLPTWSLPAPMILLGGESWTPAEFQRVGGFDFLLGSAAGDYFTVKGTTNIGAPFASWPALGTVTNTYGVLPFLDVGALTNALQFYRMQRLGP